MFMNFLHHMGDLIKGQAATSGGCYHSLDVTQELLCLGPVGINLLHWSFPWQIQGDILLVQVRALQISHLDKSLSASIFAELNHWSNHLTNLYKFTIHESKNRSMSNQTYRSMIYWSLLISSLSSLSSLQDVAHHDIVQKSPQLLHRDFAHQGHVLGPEGCRDTLHSLTMNLVPKTRDVEADQKNILEAPSKYIIIV